MKKQTKTFQIVWVTILLLQLFITGAFILSGCSTASEQWRQANPGYSSLPIDEDGDAVADVDIQVDSDGEPIIDVETGQAKEVPGSREDYTKAASVDESLAGIVGIVATLIGGGGIGSVATNAVAKGKFAQKIIELRNRSLGIVASFEAVKNKPGMPAKLLDDIYQTLDSVQQYYPGTKELVDELQAELSGKGVTVSKPAATSPATTATAAPETTAVTSVPATA